MKKTKIDWCDVTVNPVVGCSRGCPYCYAKKINDRFHFVEDFNKQQFFPDRLKQFESKKPMSIFITSMSDFGQWDDDWVDKSILAIINNKQHNYIALTKDFMNCDDYIYFSEKHMYFVDNLFYGITVTDKMPITHYQWVSIEPLLADLGDFEFSEHCKQIIVGAETGNRKSKVIPQKEWIDSIVKQADEQGIPVFMKESLRQIMGNAFRQDKLIWSIT